MRSSLNIDSSVFFSMMKECKSVDISLSYLAKEIIFYTINSFNSDELKGALTEYQNHNPKAWKCLDYNLNEDEAKYFGEARLKYRVSISKILFIGFLLFSQVVIYRIKNRIGKKKIKENSHSYVEVFLLYEYLIPCFKKRLNLNQKE